MDSPAAEYTFAAQSCLTTAAQEALQLRTAHLEPEHLLLGLLSPTSGTVWSWLTAIVGDPLALRERAKAALAEEPTIANGDPPQFSYRMRRVLSEASDEARRATSAVVDTPHLLLGLLDEGGAAAQILRQRGLEARTLRFWLKNRPADAPSVPPVAPARPRRLPDEVYELPLRQALPRLISWPAVVILAAIVAVGGWMTTRNNLQSLGTLIFVIGGWIVSVSVHEFAHALVADLGGDHSVRDNGYLSFNPLKYTHPILSVVMPVLFLLMGGIGLPGGAVYIDRSRLRSPKWHSAVSAAGPLASLIVAALMALPFILKIATGPLWTSLSGFWPALAALSMLNIAGVLLNLLPIPPLDGFGIIAPWLNPGLRATLYNFGTIGFFLVFLLLFTSDPVNQAFWTGVYTVLQGLGVNPILANMGLSQLMLLH
jgi:Zn-dependent protease